MPAGGGAATIRRLVILSFAVFLSAALWFLCAFCGRSGSWLARLPWLVIDAFVGWVVFFSWYYAALSLGVMRELVWREKGDVCIRRQMPWPFSWVGRTWRYDEKRMGPLAVSRPLRTADGPPAGSEGPGAALSVGASAGPLRPAAGERLRGAAWSAGRAGAGVGFRYRGGMVRIGRGLDQGQAARLADFLSERLGLKQA